VAREFCRQLNYGVAVSIEEGEVIITADYLGLYPLFHYQDDAVFIVTSIPGFLQCYGGFSAKIDLQGLVGILLLSHGILNRTLFQGISRLAQGHLLIYGPDGRVRKEEVPLGAGVNSPKSMNEAVEAFDSVLSKAVGRAINEGNQSILLSGGLDSRIVAGYLHRLADEELSTLTFGGRFDFEMRAAARVSSAIGATHEAIPVNQGDYPEYAKRALDTDAMSSGLYALNYWSFSATPRRPVLTGFHGDPLMGASHVGWGREPLCDVHTFHAMFASVNSWGLSPGIVRELVRVNDIDDVILDVWRQLHDQYYSYTGQPWQRSWWFDLHHRQRFLIGRLPKVIAQRSWPVLPYVHPDILQLAIATPLSLLADRKVQIELILRKYPELARLPRAGNVDHRWLFIGPRKTRPWTPYLDHVKDSVSWHLRNRLNYPDRSYFVRAFDFNGVGWKVLRDQARDHAREVDAWLDKDLLLQLIPPSSTRLEFKYPIREATGLRTLIGTVLCCSLYFANPQRSTPF
jgi:asparagine synthase (glutamine-hydrolysing)